MHVAFYIMHSLSWGCFLWSWKYFNGIYCTASSFPAMLVILYPDLFFHCEYRMISSFPRSQLNSIPNMGCSFRVDILLDLLCLFIVFFAATSKLMLLRQWIHNEHMNHVRSIISIELVKHNWKLLNVEMIGHGPSWFQKRSPLGSLVQCSKHILSSAL